MNRTNRLGYVFLAIFALSAVFSILAFADTTDPFGVRGITLIQSSRTNLSAYAPQSTTAEAGNITEMNLNSIAVTKSWQGYYGNITGTITLQDVSGFVFYNWSAAEPQGEIYASVNDSIVWSAIKCFDFLNETEINLSTEEARYGLAQNDADGIDETFTQSGLDTNFFVGSRNITDVSPTACQSTNTFRNSTGAGVADDFENTLLTDGAGALVFTTIIENNLFNQVTDVNGFDGRPHDFQLLVGENGHDGFEDTSTTYYFWAEIQ